MLNISDRLTMMTANGPILKLDEPKNTEEFLKQTDTATILAIHKLSIYEDCEEKGLIHVFPLNGGADNA